MNSGYDGWSSDSLLEDMKMGLHSKDMRLESCKKLGYLMITMELSFQPLNVILLDLFWERKISLCYLFLSVVSDFGDPWTIAHQAPLSLDFSRQEYWSGVPLPSPIIFLLSAKKVSLNKIRNDICNISSKQWENIFIKKNHWNCFTGKNVIKFLKHI